MSSSNAYFIYGKAGCPYCDKVKILLDQLSLKYEYEEVENEIDRTKLKELFKHPSFPMVFYENTFIGGFDELQQYLLVCSDF